jgi:hypothetical protein
LWHISTLAASASELAARRRVEGRLSLDVLAVHDHPIQI